MPTAKRHSLQVSDDVMTLFRECHEKVGASSIGASVKETILVLRREGEENNGCEESFVRRELKHLERMRKEKGVRTIKEALCYLRGRIEGDDTTQEVNQTSQHKNAPSVVENSKHPCPYYSLVGDIVHCSKDLKTKVVIHRVTREICDRCWELQQARRRETPHDKEGVNDSQCLSRFEADEESFCAKDPAHIRKLEDDLTACQDCPDRLTDEIIARQDVLVQSKRIVTCGATEVVFEAQGRKVFSRHEECPHRKRWITLDMCEDARCPLLKKVKVKIGAETGVGFIKS